MTLPLFLGGIGLPEIIAILVIILLFFGAKKIPELMKSLGKGVKSFKEGVNEVEKDLSVSDTEKEEKPDTGKEKKEA
ncbi:twin-arginine translocase TatA/TatE family subunit [Muribaculum sp. An289]|nr:MULTISPECIES: twin-arginine translocase TatA/TatE family subunit [unclassified Muribaculum]OUO36055.1 twin-arginine translocase TatA/TatE family subunit [Muribaculum sp. An289]OUO40733.1 twin-arginine translocase TatA/TatE family subunit [Muribaculum sp. An287]